MKKIFTLVSCALIMASCGTTINSDTLMQATGHALTALTLSDADVVTMSKEYVAQLDAQSKVAAATDPSMVRLTRLLKNHTNEGGMTFNYKVYKTSEVNAFACADGSIRVYEGLLNLMTDDEVLAVVGHEIGHVVNTDVKNSMKNAYKTAAIRTGLASTSGTVGALSAGMVGEIASALASSQYSQKQEFAADDYALNFLVKSGYNKYGMYNALNKLASLSGDSGGNSSGVVSGLFSSHPDTVARSERAKAKADAIK